MITADQLVAHAVGDYILQSDWMANEKTKRSVAALAHAVTYALPFLLLTRDPRALAFIAGTHFLIDRFRLARYLVWAKNFLAPMRFGRTNGSGELYIESENGEWADCQATGYHKDRPAFLAVWLLIIADNIMHVALNGLAIHLWGPA